MDGAHVGPFVLCCVVGQTIARELASRNQALAKTNPSSAAPGNDINSATVVGYSSTSVSAVARAPSSYNSATDVDSVAPSQRPARKRTRLNPLSQRSKSAASACAADVDTTTDTTENTSGSTSVTTTANVSSGTAASSSSQLASADPRERMLDPEMLCNDRVQIILLVDIREVRLFTTSCGIFSHVKI